MRIFLFLILCGSFLPATAQERFAPSPAQHSHNDYAQAVPFFTAYQHRFASIEADIFLVNAQLVVAHDSLESKKGRTLKSLYLDPLDSAIKANQGFAYPEKRQTLQLLIDVKTEAYSTLDFLIAQLQQYPDIIHCPSLRVVISGNRPNETDYDRYPGFLYFDGRPRQSYSTKALHRVAMISDDFQQHSKWKGQGRLAPAEKNKLRGLIQQAHRLHKPFRFWGSPDTPAAWKQLAALGVDYINTDQIEALSGFFQNAASEKTSSKN